MLIVWFNVAAVVLLPTRTFINRQATKSRMKHHDSNLDLRISVACQQYRIGLIQVSRVDFGHHIKTRFLVV